MGFCGTSSWWAKCTWLCVIVAAILDVVAWSTPSWMIATSGSTTTRVGLWKSRVCSTVCTESTINTSLRNDAFRVTQAMETIAFIIFLLLPIVIGVYVFAERFRGPKLLVFCMVSCFVTGIFLIMGMIAWLVYIQDPWDISYSFGLSIMACILVIIAGLLFIPDIDGVGDYWLDSGNSSSDRNRRYKRRSVSPRYDNERGRHSATTGLSRNTEYDRMPSPMTPVGDTSRDSYNSRGYRPATYNDVSPVSLQRDQIGNSAMLY